MNLTDLQTKLITEGTSGFSLYNMNQLIVYVANEKDIQYSDVTDQTILDYHKGLKKDIFNEKCEDTIVTGFVASNGHTYRLNRDDQLNMMGQKDELLEDTTITTVPWKTEDQGYVDHTREDWLQVYKEAFAYKKTTLYKYNSLKKALDDAADHPAIIAVTW